LDETKLKLLRLEVYQASPLVAVVWFFSAIH
jgi:hypothetical protein